jgi:hypothetical protein
VAVPRLPLAYTHSSPREGRTGTTGITSTVQREKEAPRGICARRWPLSTMCGDWAVEMTYCMCPICIQKSMKTPQNVSVIIFMLIAHWNDNYWWNWLNKILHDQRPCSVAHGIIPATWEAEMGRARIQAIPGKKFWRPNFNKKDGHGGHWSSQLGMIPRRILDLVQAGVGQKEDRTRAYLEKWQK